MNLKTHHMTYINIETKFQKPSLLKMYLGFQWDTIGIHLNPSGRKKSSGIPLECFGVSVESQWEVYPDGISVAFPLDYFYIFQWKFVLFVIPNYPTGIWTCVFYKYIIPVGCWTCRIFIIKNFNEFS